MRQRTTCFGTVLTHRSGLTIDLRPPLVTSNKIQRYKIGCSASNKYKREFRMQLHCNNSPVWISNLLWIISDKLLMKSLWCKKKLWLPQSPWKMKTFGLLTCLTDRAWIWLDFPDFKHYFIKEVYKSDACFAGCGPRTCNFRSGCYHIRSQFCTSCSSWAVMTCKMVT